MAARRPHKSGSYRERRPGVWELRVPLGTDSDGKQLSDYETFHGTEDGARVALAEFMVRHARNPVVEGGKATMSDLLDRHLAVSRREWSPTTYRRYKHLVDQKIRPGIGSVQVRALSTARLSEFLTGQLAKGAATSTVRQMHAIISRALTFGIEWEWCSVNVARSVRPPRGHAKQVNPPTAVQVRKLMAEASADLRFAIVLLSALGCRRGEVCGLRWGDVDPKRGILIERSVTTVKGDDGELIVKGTKSHAARRVSVDKLTLSIIEARRKVLEAERGGTDQEDYMLTRTDGKPLHPDTISREFRRLADKHGCQHVRTHDLRHAAATEMVAAGVDIRTVSNRLGHATSSQTLNTYAHAAKARDDAAASVLSAIFLAEPKKPAKRKPPKTASDPEPEGPRS